MDPNGAWSMGTPPDVVAALAAYWRTEFLPAFRAEHEPRLNALRQFSMPVDVDGTQLRLHFVHERGAVQWEPPSFFSTHTKLFPSGSPPGK